MNSRGRSICRGRDEDVERLWGGESMEAHKGHSLGKRELRRSLTVKVKAKEMERPVGQVFRTGDKITF